MYRRLLSIIAIGLSVSACVPYYSGSSGYYRSEVYSAPAPEYYGGGYRPYYVYPRAVYAPPPRYYHGPRYYPSQQAYQGRATISPHEAITGIEVTVPITGPVMVPVPETVGVADREVDNRGGLS